MHYRSQKDYDDNLHCLSILILLVLAIFLYLTGTAYPEKAPDKARIPSFTVSKKSAELISPLDRALLSQDNYFIKTLTSILENKDLSEADKVDAFYLMLKKIKWQFTGTFKLPPNYTYFKIFRGTASTFLMYQRSLQLRKYNVSGLIDIVRSDCNTNVVRCSNALLLSSMLNPEATGSVLGELIDPEKLAKSQVPPILVHHLSLAVVLSKKHLTAAELGDIAHKIPIEESQEDILCGLSMFNSELTQSKIKKFLYDVVNQKFDSSVETGLLILFESLDSQSFDSFYSGLIDSVKDSERKKTLTKYNYKKIKEASLGGTTPRGWTKLWDGYNVTVYDDGLYITYGSDFADFIEY